MLFSFLASRKAPRAVGQGLPVRTALVWARHPPPPTAEVPGSPVLCPLHGTTLQHAAHTWVAMTQQDAEVPSPALLLFPTHWGDPET